MKAAFHTLGCKVNQYETEAMKEQFVSHGFEVVSENDAADVYIINTCTVTNLADRKSRQYIRRMKRISPGSVIAVTGCYSQVRPEELISMPEVDIVTGNGKKSRLIQLVEDLITRRAEAGLASIDGDDAGSAAPSFDTDTAPASETISEIIPYDELTEYTDRGIILSMEGRTRAYIKIQEGCDRFCSYCLIPFARGHVRSRDPEEILEEARTLIDRGFHEIVLTGINTALYGTEKGFSEKYAYFIDSMEKNILEKEKSPEAGSVNALPSAANISRPYGIEVIIRAISALPGQFRIRLSSLEPTVVNADYVKRLVQYEKLCPHLHLSIQSGSDRIISAMNRHYTREEYLDIVSVLRSRDSGFGVTTDIIVGFPGETEEDFSDSLDMVRQAAFLRVHTFRYSKRSGTKAASLKGQVPGIIKNQRADRLILAGDEAAKEFYKKEMGKIRTVLFEEVSKGNSSPDGPDTSSDVLLTGYTENYIRTACTLPVGSKEDEYLNRLVPVRLTGISDDGMTGEILL